MKSQRNTTSVTGATFCSIVNKIGMAAKKDIIITDINGV